MAMTSISEIVVERAMRFIARCLAAGRLKTVANGIENLPQDGPAVIVMRHYHHLFDGLTIFAAVKRRFHIVVTLDWVRTKAGKIFMQSINRIARWPTLLRRDALNRHAGRQGSLFSPGDVVSYQREAMIQAVELLVQGRIIVVFPEGYPNIDPTYTPKTELEEFLPFRSGFVSFVRAAEIHLGNKIPIIPAGVRYEHGKPWTGFLRFGQALYRQDLASREELIERLETEVKKLSGIALKAGSSVTAGVPAKRNVA
jgi:putative membrane protein